MDLKEAYGILAVAYGATEAEVRAAYKDLVAVWHPDRFPNNARLKQKAEAKLKQINVAFQTIEAAGFPRLRCGSASAPSGAAQATSKASPPTDEVLRRKRPTWWLLAGIILATASVVISQINHPHRARSHLVTPKMGWTFSTGYECTDGMGLSVDANTVLVNAENSSTVDDPKDGLHYHYGTQQMWALDKGTGKERWHLAIAGHIEPPLLDGRTVYYGSHSGWLTALDSTTGHELWKRNMRQCVVSTPFIRDGTLYVETGANWDRNNSPDCDYGYLYALNAATRRIIWRLRLGKFPKVLGNGASSLLVVESAGVNRGFNITSIDWSTGKRQSKAQLPDDVATCIMGDQTLYCVIQDDLVALNTRTLRQRWLLPGTHDENADYHALCGARGTVWWYHYLPGEDRCELRSVRTGVWSGKYRWRTKLPVENQESVLASGYGLVAVGGALGRLRVYDMTNGVCRWEGNCGGHVSPIVISNGHMYFAAGTRICSAELPSSWVKGERSAESSSYFRVYGNF